MKHIFRSYFFTLFYIISCVYASTLFAASNLVRYKYLGEFDIDKARLMLQAMPLLNTLNPVYSTKLYKIDYKTVTPNGKSTQASGLVTMPSILQIRFL